MPQENSASVFEVPISANLTGGASTSGAPVTVIFDPVKFGNYVASPVSSGDGVSPMVLLGAAALAVYFVLSKGR